MTVINKMVHPKDVQGKIYRFKSTSECFALGIPPPVLPDNVRGHMVLVLGIIPGKLGYVKLMTITSTLKDDGDYVPISPTPKKGFSIQLRFRSYLKWHHGDAARIIPRLRQNSFLKIDAYYEVPIQTLVEATDDFGTQFMIWSKHRGGLGELRDYVRRRDLIRERSHLIDEKHT